MNNKLILIFFSIIQFWSILNCQSVQQAPWSNCEFSSKNKVRIIKWLNRSFNEAKEAIKNGRIYNGKKHQLEPCKIKEIESIYNNLIFEYDCSCGFCGFGGTSHESAEKRPYVRICQPKDLYIKRVSDLNKKPDTLCGCIQGLIVHELVHAAGDPTEEGAVDCSKILYPCALDPYGDETEDHSNCNCCKIIEE